MIGDKECGLSDRIDLLSNRPPYCLTDPGRAGFPCKHRIKISQFSLKGHKQGTLAGAINTLQCH
jgi:hypothetical protein